MRCSSTARATDWSLEPVKKRNLLEMLRSLKPSDEQLPEIDDPFPGPSISESCWFAVVEP